MARFGRWRFGWTALVTSTMLSLTACIGVGGRGPLPPSPTASLEPAVVSTIVTSERDAFGHRVTLADGTQLRLDVSQSSRNLTNGFGQVQPGDLVLAGPGTPPAWWTAAAPKNGRQPSGAPGSAKVPDDQCWYVSGGAFDEGDAIHFSSGLRLPKAPAFTVVYDWIPDPFPTRDGDYFCVDTEGTVTNLDFIWGPI